VPLICNRCDVIIIIFSRWNPMCTIFFIHDQRCKANLSTCTRLPLCRTLTDRPAVRQIHPTLFHWFMLAGCDTQWDKPKMLFSVSSDQFRALLKAFLCKLTQCYLFRCVSWKFKLQEILQNKILPPEFQSCWWLSKVLAVLLSHL